MQKLVLSVLSGAAAGYITNDVAIQMLFKKYLGKFGGVIVETRDSFEENVSKLIEEEVINHHTLKKEIESPEFRQELLKVIHDFYEVSLKDKCGDLYFGQLSKYNESKDSVIENFGRESRVLFDGIISSGASTISISSLIDDSGIEVFSSNVCNLAYDVLRDEEYIGKFCNDLIEEHNEKTISDLMTSKPLNSFRDGILGIVEGLGEKILNDYSDKLNTTCEAIYDTLELDTVIREFVDNIQDKSVLEVLGSKKSKILIEEIKKNFIKFIRSSNGKEVLKDISSMIIDVLKDQKISLSDILEPSMKSKVNKFFIEQLPDIIAEITSWLRRNKGNFESALEESVDEVIAECGTVKGTILKIIRNTFLDDIASKYAIVDKGIHYLEQFKDDKELGRELAQKALKIFEEKSIGEIISDLEGSKVISIDGIQEFLKFNIEEIINKVPEDSILKLLDIKISKIVPENLNITSLIRKKIKDEVATTIEKNIKNGKFEKQVKEVVKNEISILKDKQLKEFVGNNIDETIESLVEYSLKKIEENKPKLIASLSSKINEIFGGRRLNEIFPSKSLDMAGEQLQKLALERLEEGLKGLKGTMVSDLVNSISESKNIDDKSVDAFLSVIDDKLEVMLKGNISKVVANNIHSLDNNELNDMVKDFMGRELKAINIAGAGLGGLVGLAAGSLSGNIGVNILLYSAIGVITNAMAIEMLFKPYESVMGIQGVVPKNKPRFAKNMARFVDEKLLNKRVAVDIFHEKKDEILKLLKDEVSKNNFKVIEELLLNNSDSIFNISYEVIKAKALSHRNKISKGLSNSVGDIQLDRLPLKELKDKLLKLKVKALKGMEELLFNEIVTRVRSNEALEDLISIDVRDHIDEMLKNKVEEVIKSKGINNIQSSKLLKFVYKGLKGQDEIFDRKLNEIFGKNTALGRDINNYIDDLLHDKQLKKSIMGSIKEGFTKEFHKNKRMDQLFDGELVEIIRDNKEKFVKTFYNQIANGFKNEKSSLTAATITGVTSELGFFEKGAYKLMGGDSLVSRIVSKFIDKKVPYLIEDSKSTLARIIEKIMNDFASCRVEDFSIKLNSSSVGSLVDNITASSIVKEKMGKVSNLVMSDIMNKTPKDYLKAIEVKSLVDIFKLVESDLVDALENLEMKVEGKVENISRIVTRLLKDFIKKEIYSLEISSFTKGLDDDEIRDVMKKVYSNIFYTNAFEGVIEEYSDKLIEEANKMDVSELLDILNLENNIGNLLKDEGWHLEIRQILEKNCKLEVEKQISLIFNSVEDFTKIEVSGIIIDSFISSLSDNFEGILKSLNIAKITEEEINLMDNGKLREVFLKIVGTYFRKLKIYGINGFAFGIYNYLSLALVAVYIGSILKGKKVKTQTKVYES